MTASSFAVLPAGTVVGGKLRVVRLLGSGGMAAVYEVEHQLTKHRRALKLLLPEMLKHPTVVARFLREASAAGHIGNPHVVETFDAGTLEGGEPYIVMEMLVGEPLGERFHRERRLPLADLADIVAQACDGVEAAHAAGIVHRDLKPDNLFLVDQGGSTFVKVLDFGISKFDPALTGGPGMTNEGATIGTPYYMSPEQVKGSKDLDARADVYALGVILYEGAAGARPFDAEALPLLSVLIHEGKPKPLGELRPDLPPAFLEVVRRAMATDRDTRYASARELAAQLEPFRASALDATIPGSLIAASPTGPPGPPRAIVRASSSRPPPPEEGRAGTGTLASRGSQPPSADASRRTPVPSNFGAARSIADEPAERSARGRPIWIAGVGVTLALLLVGYRLVVASSDADSPAPAALVQPSSATTALPVAIAGAVPSAPVAAASSGAPAAAATPKPATDAGVTRPPASSGVAKALPSASAAPSARPEASTRVDQKGLAGDNPFR